jgi:hypothetical protein
MSCGRYSLVGLRPSQDRRYRAEAGSAAWLSRGRSHEAARGVVSARQGSPAGSDQPTCATHMPAAPACLPPR